MLQNPHWERGTFSHFISWLSSKDPKELYPWHRTDSCLFAQYANHLGVPCFSVLYGTQGSRNGLLNITTEDYTYIGSGWKRESGGDLDPLAWTFGQALDRAIEVGQEHGLLLKVSA